MTFSFFLHRFSKKVVVLLIVVCIFTWWRVWFLQLTHTNTKKQQQTYIVCIVKSLLMNQIHSPLGSFASRIAAGNNNIHSHTRNSQHFFWNYFETDEHCQWYRWWIRLIEFRNGTSRKDFFLFILPVWSWDSSEILPKITEFLINRILHH